MYQKWMKVALLGLFVLALSGTPAKAEWGVYNPFGSKPAKKTAKKEPSTLSKMNHSTQQFFSKTADFLNPFNDADEKPKKKVIPKVSRTKETNSSWWSSMFGGGSEPEPPETVDQFMSLDRPKF
ncbi:hypothetical protein LOC68_26510 [Blastopirellula sp. JC732]|uniref:Uncharacterized protein n=1 Tax=Blastopirellula sediminis TaxID=2894196 RepID=A0A9X1SMR9_9BACT|nr:hypothetical protein [Blastopirellula sediminis]MCC9604737.1 hypothetical protein [Blastopirellula sediminis]MCC9631964.1 hypothetical protein [Blastopirellula sediminis]